MSYPALNLPACFVHAFCLFLVASVSSSCTMVKVEHRVAGQPAAFSSFTIPSGHVVVASVFPSVVSGSLSSVPFLCQHVARVL